MIITQVGCSNEFDKQYDGLMVSAKLNFQKKDFNKAAEKFYEASQIHHMSDDSENRQKALIGFFESCSYMLSPERERFLTKLKSSLPSMPPAEQESFFFLSTGNSQIDNSVVAEIRSSAAEMLRKRVNPQVNWRKALVLELRIVGVNVEEIDVTDIIINGRTSKNILVFGEINPQSDCGKIEYIVKQFLYDYPVIGRFEFLSYMDEKARIVKICDL